MWSMIESLPAQYRWAAELAGPQVPGSRTVLVCDMGGSGISGDFAQVVADGVGIDVRVHKDYGLPAWVGSVRPLTLAVSYSGDTAETLSAVEAARALDLDVAVISTGGELARIAAAEGYPALLVPAGLQPRAALGYLVGAALVMVASATSLSDPAAMLLETAQATAELLGTEASGRGHGQARTIAAALEGRTAVIWGSAGPTEVAAQRWAKQLNENAKTPAYWSTMPELNHNELVGWDSTRRELYGSAGIVILRDEGERQEVSRRFDLTVDLVRESAPIIGEVWTTGESVLARAATASLIGDLVSVYVAEAAGIDPVPVDVITELKNRL